MLAFVRRIGLALAFIASFAGAALSADVGSRRALFGAAGNAPVKLAIPSGFNWTPPFNLFRTPAGVYSTDFNINSLKPTVSTVGHVNVATGVNSGTTCSSGSPCLSLSYCLSTATVDQCVIDQAGTQAANGAWILWGTRGFSGTTPTRSVSVVVAGGGRAVSVKSPASTPPTWTLFSGNAYSTPLTGSGTGPPTDLSLLDGNGDFVQLVHVASAAAVVTTPNSWFYDGSTTIYVQAQDSRNLVGDLKMAVQGTGNNGAFNTASALTLWVSNIDFVAAAPFNATQPSAPVGAIPVIAISNCTFQGSTGAGTGADGFTLNGQYAAFIQGSRSSKNWNDGWGYHAANAVASTVFEYGNSTGFNGNGNSSDQASSLHDASIGITLNPAYAGASNQTIKDIGTSQRWILGGSLAAPVETDSSGFTISISNAMWLDGTAVTPAGTFTLDIESPSILHYRNNPNMPSLTKSAGGGTLATY